MLRRVLPSLAAMALLACSAKEGSDEQMSLSAPAELNITAHDFGFEAPDSVPSGWTRITLVNHGPSLHHAMLVRFSDGKTLADLEAFMKSGATETPPWLEDMGGPNPPPPGGTSVTTEMLEPGSYAVICVVDVPDHVPHVMKGMSKPFIVTSAVSTMAEPTADVTMTLADYSFTASTPLTAGKHVVRVENVATQSHELILIRLAEGKTVDDLMAWGATYEGDLPGASMGGLAPIKPGGIAYVDLDLTPGNYVLLCFVPDKGDGKPHVMHGMMHPFTIE